MFLVGRIRNAIRQDAEFKLFVGWRYRLSDLPETCIGYTCTIKS